MLKFVTVPFINVVLTITFCTAQDLPLDNKVTPHFEEQIRPLLQRFCAECHAPGNMGDIDFLALKTEADIANHRDLFASVVEQMQTRAMPPADFEQPSDAERQLVTDWIKKKFDLKPKDIDRIATYVVEVYEDRKGHLWFGTVSNGAARYDGESLTWFTEKDGLPSNTVSSIAEDKDGNLWLGTHNGICKFDGKAFTVMWRTSGRHDQGEGWMGVFADRSGTIWTSTNEAVFRFDGTAFSEFKLPIFKEEIKSYGITSGKASLTLEDRKGNLWFKTDGSGAFKFDGKSFTHFTVKDGLCSNNVTSILEDKSGNIWFACMQSFQPEMTGDGGLCRYNGDSFTKFPEVKGLSQNDIYTIYETRAGDLWIGATNVGAYRYDGNAFTLFDKTDRMQLTRHFGLQSILEARNETLWFGFSGGLFRFNGQFFFNISKDGPWDALEVTMSKIITGEKALSQFIHTDMVTALAAMGEGKFDQAKAVLLQLKKKLPNEATIQERSMTMLGYQLMNMKRLDLAIEVLKINTELHPEHFNAYDSLGEAYLRIGNEQLGIENYEKSLELNPANKSAMDMLRKLAAGKEYKEMLVAPEGWMEEVIISPPEFAPAMSLIGMEHLRLPPEFRNPDSEWFCSYCFAIDLKEPFEANEESIGDQLLIYFRGLASGGTDKKGNVIDTDKFSIESPANENNEGEFSYVLTWQEPFVDATRLKQNIRVKIITGKNKHGVVFVCGSPQQFGASVWQELLEIRSKFARFQQ